MSPADPWQENTRRYKEPVTESVRMTVTCLLCGWQFSPQPDTQSPQCPICSSGGVTGTIGVTAA